LTFVRDQAPEVRSRLEETKALDDETERLLEAAVAEYKRQIQGSKKYEPTLAGTT
jgi:hypothetical protein